MASIRMVSYVALVCCCLAGAAVAGPQKPAFWKGTAMDGMVEEMRSNCDSGTDSLACMKFKVASFLDSVFAQDNFQMFGDVEVRANGAQPSGSGARAAEEGEGIVEAVEKYVETHDVTFNVPAAGAKVTVSPKDINNDELSVKIKFAPEGRSAVEARKSKLKKIVIPIMVFVLLKAMTLIPLALGVLGLKAFNALQLSFFSFVASIALAIFQLCKKIATDNHHPQLAAHAPWEVRSFGAAPVAAQAVPEAEAQNLAYAAYTY